MYESVNFYVSKNVIGHYQKRYTYYLFWMDVKHLTLAQSFSIREKTEQRIYGNLHFIFHQVLAIMAQLRRKACIPQYCHPILGDKATMSLFLWYNFGGFSGCDNGKWGNNFISFRGRKKNNSPLTIKTKKRLVTYLSHHSYILVSTY